MNNVADVLDKAADALLIYGRCRGAGIDDEHRMCVRGAILYAEGGDPAYAMGMASEANWALQRFLDRNRDEFCAGDQTFWPTQVNGNGYPSFIFNDRTHDDGLVLEALWRTAKELREKAGDQ